MLKNFSLNDEQYKKACEFEERHRHKETYKGAIGGHLSVTFTITSIGTFSSIKCGICNEEEDITDYSSL